MELNTFSYLAGGMVKFYPDELRTRYEIQQWRYFQGVHVGPMFGPTEHYIRFTNEDAPYAKQRYHTDVLRPYSVLENSFGQSEYIGWHENLNTDIASYCCTKG